MTKAKKKSIDNFVNTTLIGNPDATKGFFPTVEELDNMNISSKVEKHLAILEYYASDPLKDIDEDYKNSNDYKNLVEYCNELIKTLKVI